MSSVYGSLQGEHVFNALGNLVKDLADVLRGRINGHAPEAAAMVDALHESATRLIDARDHQYFRSGPKGDARNSGRYSRFSLLTRSAVDNITTGRASMQTAGYTQLNRFLDDIEHYTVDTVARDAVRDGLPGLRRRDFDLWFSETNQMMYDVYRLLRDTALAVARTRAA